MASVTLKVHGMDCAEEIDTLRSALRPAPGVRDLSFNLLDATMTVEYDAEATGPDRVIEAVGRTGMRAETLGDAQDAADAGSWWDRWGRTVLTTFSGVAAATAMILHTVLSGWRAALGADGAAEMPVVVQALYLAGTLAGVWQVLPKAWHALRRVRPDMNLLMVIAVAGALAIGEWAEAATVAFLFALSLALESWSVGRARRAVAALMALAPPQARTLDDSGNETVVAVERVAVGQRFLVRPGEKVPLDGRVEAGRTTVNQAPITGESMPVAKEAGDEVFAGSLNEDGAIEAVAIKPADQSTVAQIIKLVREAQARRSPSEQWVDRFARWYTPAVMALAIVVAVGFPLVLGDWGRWFYSALVLLVIACPCALVISTPVSIVAGLAASAGQGVLIKGGLYVELPARIEAIAFDKTGTLTEGRPAVQRVVPRPDHTEDEVLTVAAAIESRSEHPLGRAIAEYARRTGLPVKPIDDFQAVQGKGATATLSGRPVWLGSPRYLRERHQDDAQLDAELAAIASEGASIVVVGDEEGVYGFIAVADQVRRSARASIEALRAAGIRHVVMLTGDNERTGQAVGRQVGVDETRADLLPQDKVRAVEELVARHGGVAMVGDGVNDAPAMARADLGIAMGAAGTDAAIETADIALMGDDLSKLPWLIRHARRTVAIIRQNITASLAVKGIFVALTFAGYASLWAAIAADTGMSLLVVFNALRLLRPGNPRAQS